MLSIVENLISKIGEKGLTPSINMDRPLFLQPEDRIIYRATRVIIILGNLNAKTGLSKEVIACVDFLLRNPTFQKKFLIEYFKGQNNFIKKLNAFAKTTTVEHDSHIIQYKSVPWDLRFNDMFLFLHVRELVKFIGKKPNLRVILTESGKEFFSKTQEFFGDECNFLEIFGQRLTEDKTKRIITEVIPSTYWRENEKLDYQ